MLAVTDIPDMAEAHYRGAAARQRRSTSRRRRPRFGLPADLSGTASLTVDVAGKRPATSTR